MIKVEFSKERIINMVTKKDAQEARNRGFLRRIFRTGALPLLLLGLHSNAEAQQQNSSDSSNVKDKIELKGSAGLRQPMITLTTNPNGGFTTTGATLGMANGQISFNESGFSLSGNSVFLLNGNFNDAQFNALMTVFNASLKKTLGENSSIEMRAGRFMKGQEMHFANGVQAPQSDLYASLLKKFGNQSDILAMRYSTTIDGVKTFGEIGFAVPARGGVNMFVNMDDPTARQFIMDLGVQAQDVLGIDALSIKSGAKISQDGTTLLSGNIAAKEGNIELSVGAQDFNPKESTGLWLFRLNYDTERMGTIFVNADGTFQDGLGNNVNLTAGVDMKSTTIEVGVGKTQEGSTMTTGKLSFKLAPSKAPRGS